MSFIDPEIWIRYGQGKIIEFELSDEQIETALNIVLQPADKFFIIAIIMNKIGTKFVESYEIVSVEKMREYAANGIWKYYFGSHEMHDISELNKHNSIERLLLTNGLIMYQHSRIVKNSSVKPVFGIVDKVVNIKTSEILTHNYYLDIFNKLRSTIKQNRLGKREKTNRLNPRKN